MRIVSLLLLAYVSGAGAGTAVGNPTGFTLDTAGSDGLVFTAATAEVDTIVVTDRKGATSTLAVDGPFDLLGGTRVEMPLADAARVRVVFAGPLVLDGRGADGGTFALALSLDAIELTLDAPTGELPDAVLRLGAPGWADALGLEEGEHTRVAEGDPLHDVLAASLTEGAALYRDLDGDGRCGEGEDDEAEDEEDEDDAGDCGGAPIGVVSASGGG